MTQKERLLQLLYKHSLFDDDVFGREIADSVADLLLNNGVIVPPCKVGDVLYERIIDHHDAGRIKPYLVEEILVENDDKVHMAVCDVNNTECSFCEDQIGKTVFLTEDEARQALKEHK